MIRMESEKQRKRTDFDFIFLLLLSVAVALCLWRQAYGKEVCPMRLDDKTVARIPITRRGSVITFPVKPMKVILGRPGSFGIEYVENDLAISPLSLSARSNLFCYLQGRRFTFDLFVNQAAGCTVVQVRDSSEVQTRIDFGGK